MRTMITAAAALGMLASTAVAADDYAKGDGPAGRVNQANKEGFPTLEACQKALYAEIALQANDLTKRPKWAKNAPVRQFAANQAKATECRAASDGGPFRVYLKKPRPTT